MYLIKAILILCWFLLIPVMLGLLCKRDAQKEKNGLKLAALRGYALIFALFELISLPMIFMGLDFQVLMITFLIVTIGLSGLSLWINKKRVKSLVTFKVKEISEIPWTVWLAIALITVQCAAYVFFMVVDLDDAFFVATATTTLETNGMFRYDAYTGDLVSKLPPRYVLSPFPIFLAFVSKCVSMHPAAVAHTVIPIFFVSLAYSIYWLIGEKLFQGDKKANGLFLSFVSIIHIFSYYSVYTQGTFMLIRIWQGKAILAAILLPAIFYACIRTFKEEGKREDWILLTLLLISSCMVSSMGIMLAPIMVGIFAILYGLLGREWGKFFKGVACCVPSLVCAGMYLLIR